MAPKNESDRRSEYQAANEPAIRAPTGDAGAEGGDGVRTLPYLLAGRTRDQRQTDQCQGDLAQEPKQVGGQARGGKDRGQEHGRGDEREPELGHEVAQAGRRNQNRVRPDDDSAPTLPPMARMSWSTIASPIPAPPCARSRDLSTR